MKVRFYANHINQNIEAMFPNATLTHPNVTDTQYLLVNKDTNYVRIGNKKEWKDFNNFVDAAAYAKTVKGEVYVGIRPYRASNASVMAIINN